MTLIVDQAPSAHRGMHPRDGGSTVPAHLRAAGVRLAGISAAALCAMAFASPAMAGRRGRGSRGAQRRRLGEHPRGLRGGASPGLRRGRRPPRAQPGPAVDDAASTAAASRRRPDAGGWTWGLELVRYGWGADQREVALPRVRVGRGRARRLRLGRAAHRVVRQRRARPGARLHGAARGRRVRAVRWCSSWRSAASSCPRSRRTAATCASSTPRAAPCSRTPG